MKASRRDYQNIAAILKRHREALNKASADNCDNALDLAMNELVTEMANALQRSNPLFDRNRFRAATE